jgi:hypothetical protein
LAKSLLVAFTSFWIALTGSLYADVAYAQLSSLITQTPSSGAGSLVKMEQVDAIKNFDLSPDKTVLTVKQPGVYLAIASGQVAATNPGATGYVDCWFAKNGQPLANSNVRLSVEPSTFTGLLITQFIIELKAGDSLSVIFTASGPSLGFAFIKPDNEPGIPSFIFSMTKLE